MRRSVWGVFLVLALAGAAQGQSLFVGKPGYAPKATDITVTSDSIAKFGEPKESRLRYLGGVKLDSDFEGFGGFSALIMDEEGRKLIAISDAGTWLTADVTYEGERVTGLTNARMAPLLDDEGKTLGVTRRNAEGVARLPGGDLLVSFERRAVMLRRYAFAKDGVEAYGRIVTPFRIMQGISGNAGLEAITACPDGRYIAVTEAVKDGKARGWVWRLGGSAKAVSVPVPDEFAVTDAVCLDNGDVILLERRAVSLRSFSFSAALKLAVRLRRIKIDAFERGGDAEVLLEAGISYNIDNFEGLAVHKKNGKTVLTLISDDNFNMIQSTLLLQFEIK